MWALRVYWDRRGLGPEHLRWAQQALAVAQRQEDVKTQATLLSNIGAVHSVRGEKQQALACYAQALPLMRQVGDKGGEAVTLTGIGAVYSDLGSVVRDLLRRDLGNALREEDHLDHGRLVTAIAEGDAATAEREASSYAPACRR